MVKSNSGKTNNSMVTIVLSVIIIVGVLVFLFFLNTSTTKEADVVITSEAFEVEGMYGKSFSLKDVTSIELKDTLPVVEKKTNGAWLGETKKGYFQLAGAGECLLFVYTDNGPFIHINTADMKVIMNYKDAEKTKKVYQDMVDSWGK